ncbi:MAG: collagen-binding domain-containing protein [Ilumatobacteraceae bacterium]
MGVERVAVCLTQPLIIECQECGRGERVLRSPACRGCGTNAEYIVWNFPNADYVTMNSGTLWGTLMAPYAEVYSAADIEGGVIARFLTMDNATLQRRQVLQGTHGMVIRRPNPASSDRGGVLIITLVKLTVILAVLVLALANYVTVGLNDLGRRKHSDGVQRRRFGGDDLGGRARSP